MTTTIFAQPFQPVGCQSCGDKTQLPFEVTMAFQPIMDLELERPFAYEALVRGVDGESAGTVLSWVEDSNRYRFDQVCRVKAIDLAARLGLAALPDCRLSINVLPNAVYRAETCIRASMKAAVEFKFPHNRIMFEVTEGEQVTGGAHLKSIFNEYRRQGLITAIDDFGAGYAGLNMLVQFQPHVLKIDMELIRNIDQDPVRQAIVYGIALYASACPSTSWQKASKPRRSRCTCARWTSAISKAICSPNQVGKRFHWPRALSKS